MADRFILTPYFLDTAVLGLEQLARPGWQLNQLELPPGEKQARMVALYRPLASLVAGALSAGMRPVSLAGDCCTTIGVLAGLQQAGLAPTLIWFDAHGDFNTWETTPSGFLGGMPLAMAMGLGEQTLLAGVGLRPLAPHQIILTDGRDLDPGERELVAQSGITHLPDVNLLRDYALPDGPLYVHFDTDVVNPDELPAISYPAAGGPAAETLRQLFRHLADTGRVTAVSFSAWNPDLPGSDRSRELALSLLQELLSQS